MRIGLMADVPDQPVLRGIEHVVEGDRQLDDPSPAPRWPPVTATASTVSWRSSSASWRSWLLLRRRRSAGVVTRSRRGVLEGWATRGDSDGGGNLTGWLRFNQPGRQDQPE